MRCFSHQCPQPGEALSGGRARGRGPGDDLHFRVGVPGQRGPFELEFPHQRVPQQFGAAGTRGDLVTVPPACEIIVLDGEFRDEAT